MLIYRKATIQDAELMAKSRTAVLVDDDGSGMSPDEFEVICKRYFMNAIEDGGFVGWLAFDGDLLIATSGIHFYHAPPTPRCVNGMVAQVVNMYTYHDYRRRGIASELLGRLISEAQARGYHKISLNATKSGKPLYEKFGFQRIRHDMVLYV